MQWPLGDVEIRLASLPSKRADAGGRFANPSESETRILRKSPRHFSCPRPDVLGFVPESASNVLDLGRGASVLREAIQNRQNAIVNGVEQHATAAFQAKNRLSRVVEDDLMNVSIRIRAGSIAPPRSMCSNISNPPRFFSRGSAIG